MTGDRATLVRLDPKGPFKRDPLAPQEMHDRVTRTDQAIVLCHLGVPRIEAEEWFLVVDGLVEHPLLLRFKGLLEYPKHEVVSVHQCCGSPVAPFEPTRRVCNLRWGGVRLSDLLADAQPLPSARYVLPAGADSGEFGGASVDAYCKDLPLARVGADVMIAYEMNGSPLPAENGYPARLVVPGFYGTNSVKWLTRLTLAERRGTGPFTTRWYNDPILDGAGRETGQTAPVWSIAPESLIVAPEVDAEIPVSTETEVWGWAWADGGVKRVYARLNDGGDWQTAQLEPAQGWAWQRFRYWWKPEARGIFVLGALAEGQSGTMQALSGRRNAIHEVRVRVV